MAWVEIHDNLPDHHKVIDLSGLLKVDKDAVVGKLIRLWTWALNCREDGFIRTKDAPTLADVMRLKGRPERIIKAMVDVQLLDPVDGGWRIHDWEEHVEMLRAKREQRRKQTAERVRRYRENKARLASQEKGGECNALQDVDVTPECNASNARTAPYIDIDRDIDTTTGLCITRAQGSAVMLSTTYPQGTADMQAIWREVMGEEGAVEDVRPLTRWHDVMPKDVIRYALELAAMYNADNKGAYACTILKGWYDRKVKTLEEAEAWAWREQGNDL